MTTLLYDPESRALYSDSQATSGGAVTAITARKIQCTEIKGLGSCLIAISGYPGVGAMVTHWLTGEREDKPIAETEDYQALILTATGEVYFSEAPILEPYLADTGEVLTLGSGWQIALAVMASTHDPYRAMVTARQLDISTGGAIQKGFFDAEGEPRVILLDAGHELT